MNRQTILFTSYAEVNAAGNVLVGAFKKCLRLIAALPARYRQGEKGQARKETVS